MIHIMNVIPKMFHTYATSLRPTFAFFAYAPDDQSAYWYQTWSHLLYLFHIYTERARKNQNLTQFCIFGQLPINYAPNLKFVSLAVL